MRTKNFDPQVTELIHKVKATRKVINAAIQEARKNAPGPNEDNSAYQEGLYKLRFQARALHLYDNFLRERPFFDVERSAIAFQRQIVTLANVPFRGGLMDYETDLKFQTWLGTKREPVMASVDRNFDSDGREV